MPDRIVSPQIMSVVVAIEEVGPCRKQLTVQVPAPAVEAETRRVAEEYRRRTRMPGFRKGKVPLELVRQRYEKEIDREVVDRLVPRYWRQAEAEGRLEALMPPQVEGVDMQPGAGFTFTATVEVRPEIEIGELGELELPEMEVAPAADEIEAALEDLARQAADWRQAERPAARGDRLRGSLVALDEAAQAESPQPVDFEVGDPKVWEELSLAAVGASPGGELEFARRAAADQPERRYRLVVDDVQERLMPELDDELAGRLGDFESVEALRAAVTERLRQAKRQERRRRRETAVLDELRRRYPLALPEGVVQREVEAMLRAYAEELAHRGVDLEQAEIDWQGLAERERPQAERRVHARLLLDALADRQGLEVSEDEFEQVLAQIARAEGRTTVAVRQALDGSGRLAELRSRLRRDKLLRQLTGDGPVGEPREGSDSEPEPGTGAVDTE